MRQTNERRTRHRVTAGAYIEYRVTLDGTQVKDAIMSDISEGGVMILADQEALGHELQHDEYIGGEIIHDKTRLHFKFAGQVAWLQPREMRSRNFVAIGIRFDPKIELPAQIYAILMAESDF
ncbi:MAG: PilZ domain-containing protein [Spirochaetes bacterium]|nr:PilZ domain-containing protein [Spirochaetota bacterium]